MTIAATGGRHEGVLRLSGIAALGLSGALLFASSASCDNEEAPCKVDTDCAQGQICRDERCGFPGNPDASTPTWEGGAPVCAVDGTLCISSQDCCSRNCGASGRCEQFAPPPPACRGLYELCSGTECCTGYNCVAGSCR